MTQGQFKYLVIAILALFLLSNCRHDNKTITGADSGNVTKADATAPWDCDVPLVVDVVEKTPHLHIGQILWFTGPFKPSGDYMIRQTGPETDRTWAANAQWAKNLLPWDETTLPSDFLLANVDVTDTKHNESNKNHTGLTKHTYRVEITKYDEEDNCPKYAKFIHKAHPISVPNAKDDHPGHGGAGRL